MDHTYRELSTFTPDYITPQPALGKSIDEWAAKCKEMDAREAALKVEAERCKVYEL